MTILTNIKRLIPGNVGYLLRKIKLNIRGLIYRGKGFYCPICEHEYRSFFDGGTDTEANSRYQIIGSGRRQKVICPGCASTDRERLVLLSIKDSTTKLWPANQVLHIAPEPALGAKIKQWQKQSGKNYVAGAKYHEGFYYDKSMQLFDILKLPFEKESFDFVICNHVLEHIPDDRKAMREIFRVMSPKGKAILQVPWSPLLEETFEDDTITTEAEREKYFGQFDHVRIYGKDYPKILAEVGFQIEIYEANNLVARQADLIRFGLNPNEKLFIATKKQE